MNATTGIPATLLSRVWWMPPDGALHGLAIDRLMQWNLLVLCALFLLAHVLLVAIFFRSKKQSAPEIQPENAQRSIWSAEVFPLIAVSLLYAWMALTAH